MKWMQLSFILVLYAVIYNGSRALLPIVYNVPWNNEMQFHQALASQMVRVGGRMDVWLPHWGGGAAVSRYYESLNHWVAANVSVWTGFDASYLVVCFHAFYWTFFPLAMWGTMRRLRFNHLAAGLASFLTIFVQADSRPRHLVGVTMSSFSWEGMGLFQVSGGCFWFCMAWGRMFEWIVEGKGLYGSLVCLSFTWLSHFHLGYGASLIALVALSMLEVDWKGALTRWAKLHVGLMLSLAFLLLPLILESHLHPRSALEDRTFWDSFGTERLARLALKGWLFDDGTRTPWFSILVGLALVMALGGSMVNKVVHGGVRVALAFAVSGALLCGPTTWGMFIHWLPFAKGLAFHRFFLHVHLFGIMLAAWSGASALLWIHVFVFRGRTWISVVALFFLFLGFAPTTRFHMQEWHKSRDALLKQRAGLTDVWGKAVFSWVAQVEQLSERFPARSYAGGTWNWGNSFSIDKLNMYSVWTSLGHAMPNIGRRWHSMGLSDVETLFDDSDRSHYRLFNVRYIICHASGAARIGGQRVGQIVSDHALVWSPLAQGYFAFIRVPSCIDLWRHDATTAHYTLKRFVLGKDHIENLHPRLALGEWEQCRSAALELFDQHAPNGTVLHQRVTLGGNVFEANLDCKDRTGCSVMLRISYHPGFQVMGGESIRLRTFAVAPGFLAFRIPYGQLHYTVSYNPPSLWLSHVSLIWMAYCSVRWLLSSFIIVKKHKIL